MSLALLVPLSIRFNGTTADELLKQADIAMYQTKQQGRNGYMFYQSQMCDESLDSKLHLAK